MTTHLKRLMLLFACLASPFFFVGCEDEDPLEDAADNVEEAAENAGDAVEDATD